MTETKTKGFGMFNPITGKLSGSKWLRLMVEPRTEEEFKEWKDLVESKNKSDLSISKILGWIFARPSKEGRDYLVMNFFTNIGTPEELLDLVRMKVDDTFYKALWEDEWYPKHKKPLEEFEKKIEAFQGGFSSMEQYDKWLAVLYTPQHFGLEGMKPVIKEKENNEK